MSAENDWMIRRISAPWRDWDVVGPKLPFPRLCPPLPVPELTSCDLVDRKLLESIDLADRWLLSTQRLRMSFYSTLGLWESFSHLAVPAFLMDPPIHFKVALVYDFLCSVKL